MHVKASLTVNRPADEIYRYWRDFANLPRFMIHLESVQVASGTRSHWRSKAPFGTTVEWDAEITEDRPGEHIGWRSVPGRQGVQRGGGPLHAGPRRARHRGPGRAALQPARRRAGRPDRQAVRGASRPAGPRGLRRFKQVLETGEVVRSGGSPEGTKAHRQLRQRPGQPIPAAEPAGVAASPGATPGGTQ